MERILERAKSKVRNLHRVTTLESSSVTATSVLSTVPTQPAPGTTTQPPVDAPRTTQVEPSPLRSLQEQIWNQAYDALRQKEPKIVLAFESTVATELERCGTSFESADRTDHEPTVDGGIRSFQMQQLVQNGLDRTSKGASFKQGIDDSLQAVRAIRGIMDKAVKAAPEAAVVWATVCLGLEVRDPTSCSRRKPGRLI